MTKITQKKAVGTSLVVSISDVLLNLLVGLLTSSVVMISQSIQGLSDLVTAGVLFKGVKAAERKADNNYPLGYGREIFFYVLVASLFMFAGTGLVSFIIGFSNFRSPSPVDNIWLAFIMLLFGLISNGYAFNVSRKRLRLTLGSKAALLRVYKSSMVETKATFIVDLLGAISAIIGLISLALLMLSGQNAFDGIGSMAIGSVMMASSILLVLDAKSLIVGRAVAPHVTKEIIKAVTSVKGVLSVLDLKTMFLGSGRLLIIVEAHFDDALTADQIEQASDKIKTVVKAQVAQASVVQVEAETPDREITTSQ